MSEVTYTLPSGAASIDMGKSPLSETTLTHPQRKQDVVGALREAMAELAKYQTALSEMEDVMAIQGADGNWNYDPYMHGMANGMILIRSIIRRTKPEFFEAPKQWVCDVPGPDAPVETQGGGE